MLNILIEVSGTFTSINIQVIKLIQRRSIKTKQNNVISNDSYHFIHREREREDVDRARERQKVREGD